MTSGSTGHSAEAIEEWLVERVAKELKIPPHTVSVDQTFSNLGMNSLQTLIVAGDLGEFLGIEELEGSLLWDYPTILKLAEHLVASRQVGTKL